MIDFERSEQRSRFIGREALLEALASVRQSARLVSLLGAPGIGKTRLMLELAARENRAKPGAIRVVDAARAETSEVLAAEVLALLGAAAPSGQTAVEAAGHALALLGPTTLVIDNFDLSQDLGRAFVSLWLGSAPELALLVTTRSRLARTGEVLFEVPPLDLAFDSDKPSEAAGLFLDRANNVSPNTIFDAEERALIEEIVQELDGLPLAIELAAGRLRMMGLGELRARLDDPLALLVDGARKDRGRHQTLEAALEPAWQRLTDGERRALSRLAALPKPFTLGDAEAAIAADRDLELASPLDRLQSLRDQSLLMRDEDGRLRLLAPIAAFVRKKTSPAEARGQAPSLLLTVEPEGRGFRLPGGTWITLPRGSPLGRILLHLVRARREQPSKPVPLEELVRAGWPDERMLPDSARNRAYMAMSRLRKLGLEPLLARTEDGYLILPSVRAEFSEMPRTL